MKIMTDKPSTKGIMVLAISLVAWISVTAAFIGIRPEHIGLGCFIAVLFLISRATRKLVVALLSFAIFGISYDWMRIIPNYEVNPIDVKGLYETEKSILVLPQPKEFLLPTSSSISTIVRRWISWQVFSTSAGFLFPSYSD